MLKGSEREGWLTRVFNLVLQKPSTKNELAEKLNIVSQGSPISDDFNLLGLALDILRFPALYATPGVPKDPDVKGSVDVAIDRTKLAAGERGAGHLVYYAVEQEKELESKGILSAPYDMVNGQDLSNSARDQGLRDGAVIDWYTEG